MRGSGERAAGGGRRSWPAAKGRIEPSVSPGSPTKRGRRETEMPTHARSWNHRMQALIAEVDLNSFHLAERAHRLKEVLLAPNAAALVTTEWQTKATVVHGVDGDQTGFEA